MNSIHTEAKFTFTKSCLASCKKIVRRVRRTKRALLKEFEATFDAQKHMLRLAVNEAEALAWQSGFPQLFFPDLAMEKAQAVVAWKARQQSITT